MDQRPATVEDLLRQEDWGQALVDPTGSILVFEQTPPYNQLPDYSIPWSSRYPLPNFGKIMVVSLKEMPTSRLLFEPQPKTLYRIQSFSPDGRCLALYAVKDGEVTLVVYELLTGRLSTFKETPELNFMKRPLFGSQQWRSFMRHCQMVINLT